MTQKEINGVTFNVNISENHYSQRFNLDSTGSGSSELYKRIE
jgi:hypothetical protein